MFKYKKLFISSILEKEGGTLSKKELVNKFLLKYALLTAQAKVFLKTNKIDSNFERA